MIKTDSLDINWIATIAKQRKADPMLVEKVIRALWLLEGLVIGGLPFTFKGGTALMLKLGSTRRLSIDIDIIITKKEESLNALLNKIAEERGFTKVEEQKRQTKSAIEKAHYKFFYKPVAQKAEQAYVLLDILFGDSGYHKIESQLIESTFLSLSEEQVKVTVPSFEDLTGDKLTAFAPETTGIPYIKNEQSASMEIIKQLYDLGYLFDQIKDLQIVRKTFDNIAQTELSYRKIEKVPQDVLEDTFQASLCLSSRGVLGNGNFEELLSGVKRIQPYIFSESYNINKAISQASKVAHLTRLLLIQENTITRFKSVDEINDWAIEDHSLTKLNKLKKTDPEAYYYWHKSVEINSKHSG